MVSFVRFRPVYLALAWTSSSLVPQAVLHSVFRQLPQKFSAEFLANSPSGSSNNSWRVCSACFQLSVHSAQPAYSVPLSCHWGLIIQSPIWRILVRPNGLARKFIVSVFIFSYFVFTACFVLHFVRLLFPRILASAIPIPPTLTSTDPATSGGFPRSLLYYFILHY